DAVVFGVPRPLARRARERFKNEAETIRAALAGCLGRTVRFKIVESDSLGALGAAGTRSSTIRPGHGDEPPGGARPPGEVVDMGPARPAVSSVDLLAQQYDATVIEERPREEGESK